MEATVAVVVGPAGCGKTERLLARYRQAIRSGQPGETLWIAPTFRSAADVRDRLLADRFDACFQPGIVTFERFVDSVLDAAEEEIRPIGRPLKRQLIRSLIAEAEVAGQLSYFASIADTDGLVNLVVQWIGDLKRLEIWPEEFAEACRQRGASDKDRELVAIYARYQQILTEHRLYDAEGRFWSARRLLREGQRRPYESLQLVVVDGFSDFTQTQHEILQVLAQRVQQLYVSLPLEEESQREELFWKPAATLSELTGHPRVTRSASHGQETPQPGAALKRSHAAIRVTRIPRESTERTDWPGLAHIERELFKSPHDVRALDQVAQRIELVAASRQLGEIEWLARRVKQRIVHEQVRPDQIVCVFRNVQDVAPLVEEAFGEAGVPVAIDARKSLSETSTVRAILSLLQLQVEDWPFRKLLSIVTHSRLQPAWRSIAGEQGAMAAEHLVRRLQIPAGRSELLRRVAQLAEKEQAAPPRTENGARDTDPPAAGAVPPPDVQSARTAVTLLQGLDRALGSLPRRATLSQWSTALGQLAETVELDVSSSRSDCSEDEAAELAEDAIAWERFRSTLVSGDSVSAWLGRASWSLPLEGALPWLKQLADDESLPVGADATGKVRILSAPQARALRIDHLLVAGLSETSFPAPSRGDRLYSEAETRRLAEAGLPLIDGAQRNREEMLLFYETVTRARKSLTLSYPAFDAKAQPLLPSPFLIELERACGEGKIRRTECRDLSPVPTDSEPVGPTQSRLLAVASLLANDPAPLADLLGVQASATDDRSLPRGSLPQRQKADRPATPEIVRRERIASSAVTAPTIGRPLGLLAGLEATAARQRGDTFGGYEGIVTSEAAREALCSRFGPTTLWSPSRLERYAYCPYRFFLEEVLDITPLDDLELQDDHLLRGRLLHDALATVHRELNREQGHPTSPAALGPEEFRRRFTRAIDEQLEKRSRANSLDRALRQIDRRVVLKWGDTYLEQHAQYDQIWDDRELDAPLRPSHFEVRFGPKRGGDSEEDDPLATDRPLELTIDGERLRFTGRIDRIDIGRLGKWTIYNVIDYKTGKRVELKTRDMVAGTLLQLPLYLLAANEMFQAAASANAPLSIPSPWAFGYWSIRDKGFPEKGAFFLAEPAGGGLKATETWASTEAAIRQRIGALVHGIRAAEFPMQCADEKCSGRCNFHTVCRVNQVRALGKRWPPSGTETASESVTVHGMKEE
ncbi:MAG: PD-(D/E)XK nuclease family protein [Pirellulales bacterium]